MVYADISTTTHKKRQGGKYHEDVKRYKILLEYLMADPQKIESKKRVSASGNSLLTPANRRRIDT